jgi:hypothetical protein
MQQLHKTCAQAPKLRLQRAALPSAESALAAVQWRKLAALLAIALLALFASLQTAHGHFPGGAEDSHCAFCLAAHGAAVAVAPPAVPVLVPVRPYTPTREPRTPDTTPSILHFIRPPPATA